MRREDLSDRIVANVAKLAVSSAALLAFALGVIMTEFAALDAEGICPTPQCIPSPIRRHQSVVYCFAVPAIPVELTVLHQCSIENDIAFARSSGVRRYCFALAPDDLMNYKYPRIS
jgi:hypothetical protein